MRFRLFIMIATVAIVGSLSCSNESETKKTAAGNEKKASQQDTAAVKASPAEAKRPPIINIADSVAVKRIVLCLKDSAASMDRIALKLAAIYGKLTKIIKDGKSNVNGMPMAWYKSEKAPYFFEAGLPVDKKPAKLPAGVIIKETRQDSVVIAHFFGPYDLLPQAYEAVKDWMKGRKKSAAGTPYEIYIGDPGVQKDPYKVQTDVVFPIK